MPKYVFGMPGKFALVWLYILGFNERFAKKTIKLWDPIFAQFFYL